MPTDFDEIKFQSAAPATHTHSSYINLKTVEITVSGNSRSQTIPLKIYLPKAEKDPFPVFLLISPRNVEQLTGDIQNQLFPIEQIVSRGFAAAIFDVENVSQDGKARFTKGILDQLCLEQMSLSNGMRGLSAWAWRAMRVMDYYETDSAIYQKKSCCGRSL